MAIARTKSKLRISRRHTIPYHTKHVEKEKEGKRRRRGSTTCVVMVKSSNGCYYIFHSPFSLLVSSLLFCCCIVTVWLGFILLLDFNWWAFHIQQFSRRLSALACLSSVSLSLSLSLLVHSTGPSFSAGSASASLFLFHFISFHASFLPLTSFLYTSWVPQF